MNFLKYFFKIFLLFLASVFLFACAQKDQIILKSQQENTSPDLALQILKDGNKEFRSGSCCADNISRLKPSLDEQYPIAAILSCMDSRVPPEAIFNCGIGDIFVIRLAGPVTNSDVVGSLEYACKVSGAKLILVMAHQNCGAIKSAIKDVKLGNITQLLDKIEPSKQNLAPLFEDKSYKNLPYFDALAKENAKNAAAQIRKTSPILSEMESLGQIKIVCAFYNLETGTVEFF